MAWGMPAAVNATESALCAAAREEFWSPRTLPPGTQQAVAGPGDPAIPEPLLPRRVPVAAPPDGLRHDGAGGAGRGAPGAGATGPRPDLALLAQVLRGLQRLA